MRYEIRVHRLARIDLSESYRWAWDRAPNTAARWLERFQAAIRSLEESPERCPLAVENSKVNVEIREFHFGKRTNVFRVIFHIDGAVIRVLRIRRGQRRFLTGRDISEALQSDDPLGLE